MPPSTPARRRSVSVVRIELDPKRVLAALAKTCETGPGLDRESASTQPTTRIDGTSQNPRNPHLSACGAGLRPPPRAGRPRVASPLRPVQSSACNRVRIGKPLQHGCRWTWYLHTARRAPPSPPPSPERRYPAPSKRQVFGAFIISTVYRLQLPIERHRRPLPRLPTAHRLLAAASAPTLVCCMPAGCC